LCREGEQQSGDQLCSGSEDAGGRTNLAAASSDARKGAQPTGSPAENDRRFVMSAFGVKRTSSEHLREELTYSPPGSNRSLGRVRKVIMLEHLNPTPQKPSRV